MEKLTYSIIIPVYKNQDSLTRLIASLTKINAQLQHELEVVFVVDGSPDNSFLILKEGLSTLPFSAQLLGHSRNFGSFAAIRSGLLVAQGQFFAVMAADLQEPPELAIGFFTALINDECDVVIGTRANRDDPLFSRIMSQIFWKFYRRMVVPEIPIGGVDIFGCNRIFRDQLLALEESRSSLIALVFWLGFRRKFIQYERQARLEGKSSWTFSKKIEYVLDSIFAFTDYPIRMLMRLGIIGSLLSFAIGLTVLAFKIFGLIAVPGYAATIIIVLFFGTLNLVGLGLVGNYAWRAYENSKQRPLAIVAVRYQNKGHVDA
jgi:glycosyltransferase involved in cell wall biosynthesis